MKKNMKIERKMKKFGVARKILDSFLGFTVVICFVKILDDFHDFVSECVFFQRKINNPFWEVTVFPKKKWQISLDVKQKTHIIPTKNNKKSLRSAPLSIIILWE